MSTVFNHACRYEWMDKNPIRFVRQGGMRERIPDVLDASELRLLLAQLADPYKTMVFVAAVTGLRVSEMLALKWQDIDFGAGEINLCRGIVCQHVGPMKTTASRKPIPMHGGLAAVLLDWRGVCPYNQASDYVFASPEKNGTQPYWPSNMEKHVRPAAKRAGIAKHVTWQVFRHSYGTLLKADGTDVKTTQELMRHANSKTTMDVYVQAVTPAKREAHGKVVQSLVFPDVPTPGLS
jgi:integrase